jgi:hypothetical protein
MNSTGDPLLEALAAAGLQSPTAAKDSRVRASFVSHQSLTALNGRHGPGGVPVVLTSAGYLSVKPSMVAPRGSCLCKEGHALRVA